MYTRYQFLLNIDKKKVSSEHIDRKKMFLVTCFVGACLLYLGFHWKVVKVSIILFLSKCCYILIWFILLVGTRTSGEP